MEPDFIRAITVQELKEGETKKVSIEGIDILIVNVNGKFYAVDAVCSHYGGDLSEGKLQGTTLTCPVHGAKFNVTNGKTVSPPTEPLGRAEIENLTAYLLRVENGEIFVKI